MKLTVRLSCFALTLCLLLGLLACNPKATPSPTATATPHYEATPSPSPLPTKAPDAQKLADFLAACPNLKLVETDIEKIYSTSYNGGESIFAFIKNNRYGYIRNDLSVCVEPKIILPGTIRPDSFIIDKYTTGFFDGKQRAVMPDGMVVDDISHGIRLRSFGDDLYVSARVDKGPEYLVIEDKQGNAVSGEYYMIGELKDGLAYVCLRVNALGEPDTTSPILKWGYIDSSGNEVLPLAYDYADNFTDGYAAVQKKISDNEAEFYIIDKQGKVLYTAPKGTMIQGTGRAGKFMLIALLENDDFSYSLQFIDQSGKALSKVMYIPKNASNNLIQFFKYTKSGKYGVLTRDYSVFEPQYDEIVPSNYVPIVKINGKSVVLNAQNEHVFTLPQGVEEVTQYYTEGYAYRTGKKWTLTDDTGKVLFNYDAQNIMTAFMSHGLITLYDCENYYTYLFGSTEQPIVSLADKTGRVLVNKDNTIKNIICISSNIVGIDFAWCDRTLVFRIKN